MIGNFWVTCMKEDMSSVVDKIGWEIIITGGSIMSLSEIFWIEKKDVLSSVSLRYKIDGS